MKVSTNAVAQLVVKLKLIKWQSRNWIELVQHSRSAYVHVDNNISVLVVSHSAWTNWTARHEHKITRQM